MFQQNDMYDVAVIGAGAAGLSAAIFAGEAGSQSAPLRIVLLDGAKTIGAKILISGGGRCNVTHAVVTPTDFFGNRHIIKNVLAAFPVQATINWFTSLGVTLKEEKTGKLFPTTDKARTILNALVNRCQQLGVVICLNHRITGVTCMPGGVKGFIIHHQRGMLEAKKVILATGGRSLPKTGSDGFGYELARCFGHRVTTTTSALAPLVLDESLFHKHLSGTSQEVELKTTVNGRDLDRRTGSLLWTHFGVSGPVVMNASRFWTQADEAGDVVELSINLVPDLTQESLCEWFRGQATAAPRRSLVKALSHLVTERFADAFCEHLGVLPQTAIAQLPRKDRDRVLLACTNFLLPVQHDRGWNYAEVTAGGIPLEEVNFRTMESKVVSGLYFVGEILDCDGRIGGFNFQWAWATGFLAGRAVAVRT